MGDADQQQSKKRAAGREISRDNPGLDDDEEACEEEMGTFKKASEEVLARRKIVKVRRSQTTSTPSSTPSSNPFASLKLVPFPGSSGTNVVATNESENRNSKGEAKVDYTSEIVGQSNASSKPSEFEAISDDIKHGEEEGSNKHEAVLDKTEDEAKNIVEPETIAKDIKKDPEVRTFVNEEKQTETDVDKAEDKAKNILEPETIEKDIKKDPAMSENEEKQTEAVVGKAEDEAKNIVEPKTIEKDIKKDPETSENEEKPTDGNEKVEKTAEATHFSSFQQLSSTPNAFSGLGTGFSSSSFLFGSSPASGSSPLFGLKNDSSSSFGFGSSTVSISAKTEANVIPLMQEVSVETGEENEKSVFSADSVLYDFVEGTWKERGKGELKVNVSTNGPGKARIIMRTRGNYRLILNASIYPDMKLTNMDKRGVTFACMNSADEVKKDGLSTYAVKFKDVSMVEKFRNCVMENKDKITVMRLKTPENSPDASDNV